MTLTERLEVFKAAGIIHDLKKALHFTDEPKFPQWFCQPAIERGTVLEEQCGSSLHLDDETAKTKAIGEAVERFCSETVDIQNCVWGSFRELKETIDPEEFINYSDQSLRGKRKEYIEKIRKKPMQWVRGKHLSSDDTVLIPAQLVYSPYDISNEPIIRTPISTGAAFELNEERAISRGVLEIVERDSFMLAWLTSRSCPQIDIKNNKLHKYFERYALEAYVIDVTTDLNIASMLGILIDRTGEGPAVSFGLKASMNPERAIDGALLEAQHVRQWIRLEKMQGAPDVRNPEDIVDLKTRGLYWYPVERIKDLDFMIQGDSKELRVDQYDRGQLPQHNLIQRGFNIYAVDITIPSIKAEGYFVIKSIIPEMHPLSFDEDMPYDFGERLSRYMGAEINQVPHPFI